MGAWAFSKFHFGFDWGFKSLSLGAKVRSLLVTCRSQGQILEREVLAIHSLTHSFEQTVFY